MFSQGYLVRFKIAEYRFCKRESDRQSGRGGQLILPEIIFYFLGHQKANHNSYCFQSWIEKIV